jgi:hypothetical protein
VTIDVKPERDIDFNAISREFTTWSLLKSGRGPYLTGGP